MTVAAPLRRSCAGNKRRVSNSSYKTSQQFLTIIAEDCEIDRVNNQSCM